MLVIVQKAKHSKINRNVTSGYAIVDHITPIVLYTMQTNNFRKHFLIAKINVNNKMSGLYYFLCRRILTCYTAPSLPRPPGVLFLNTSQITSAGETPIGTELPLQHTRQIKRFFFAQKMQYLLFLF